MNTSERRRLSSAMAMVLALTSQPVYSGQYQQQCEQSGQKAQQQCQGATAGANGGDMAQASSLGGSVGGSASIFPGAMSGLAPQAMGQIGRMTGASQQCEQAKDECEKQCDQQKQKAEGDEQAKKQGEPGQVDQSKQGQCSKPLDSMILPLLAALAMAIAALMAAKKTGDESKGSTPPGFAPTAAAQQTTTASIATPASVDAPANPEPKSGLAGFANNPTVKKGLDAIRDAGGRVTDAGVKLPKSEFQSWGSMVSGGSSSGGLGGGGVERAPAGFGARPSSTVTAAEGSLGDGGGSGGGYGGSNSRDRDEFQRRMRANLKSANGLSVSLNGTPIGPKGGNIFEMIHTAYDRKRKAKLFQETAPQVSRPPAK